MMVAGRILQMLLMIWLFVLLYAIVYLARKGRKIEMRSIAALDAIDEGVARAAEMGRTVHFTPGFAVGGLYHPVMGPGVVAGIGILKRVAESTAKRGTGIIVSLAQPESVPLVDEVLKVAYAAQGKSVPPDAVRFISTEQMMYASGVLSILREERPGVNILMGHFWSEAMQFSEGGAYIGALQISGTNAIGSAGTFVISSDYALIGEELFAAKAYIERKPDDLGAIQAQDFFRLTLVILVLFAWLLGNLGLKDIIGLLKI